MSVKNYSFLSYKGLLIFFFLENCFLVRKEIVRVQSKKLQVLKKEISLNPGSTMIMTAWQLFLTLHNFLNCKNKC